MFIDEVHFKVKAGNGGPGCVSFYRGRHLPKGGPDGGDGGRGGSVVFVVNDSLTTLFHLKFKQLFAAKNGLPGEGSNCSGRKGEDLIIEVPRGTVVREKNTGDLIVDFNRNVDRWEVLEGAKGGKGNTRFKSATHQTPREFEAGREGELMELQLSLKLIADVGLVGFPNAGKSSLLSRVSAARPKVADYPFTTMMPHLGTVAFDKVSHFVFADIPGLIEGASNGRGMGFQFLKHVERTRVILHLVEPDSMDGVSVPERVNAIRKELCEYSSVLAGKREILVLTKMDLKPDKTTICDWESELDEKFVCISTVTGEGIDELLQVVQLALQELEE